MAPGDLQEVLEALKPAGRAHPDLLVGLAAADDAAVYRITSDFAIVETVDFFPPVVDDPWTWGAVSAANSMSDVFAMGGEVLFALAVAGFPREMSKAIIAEVFRGGSDKVVEAGGVIAGGHTVVDNEPKYGLCVTGRVHPDRILIKGGLRRRPPHRSFDPRIPRLSPHGIGDVGRSSVLGWTRSRAGRDRSIPPPRRGVLGDRRGHFRAPHSRHRVGFSLPHPGYLRPDTSPALYRPSRFAFGANPDTLCARHKRRLGSGAPHAVDRM